MTTRRRNWQSDRSPEEIAQSRQVRLQAQILKTLLKTNAFDQVVAVFLEVINDPAATQRTRNAAAASLSAAIGRVLPQGPRVKVDARQHTMSMADLLSMVADLPNRASVVSPGEQPGAPLPNGDLQDAHRLLEPQFLETGDLTGGSSLACEAEATADAANGDERKDDPTEAL